MKSADVVYVFARQNEHPAQPFADLEHLFGVVRQPQRSETPHEAIRHRLKRVVLVNTGPLVAAIDAGDSHHAWAKATLPKLTGN